MRMPSASIAVLGSGPAGLMTASVLAAAGHRVTIFEKKRGPGKKLLIAGSSGLNITHDTPAESFYRHYRGNSDFMKRPLQAFPPAEWLRFVEDLGIRTFLGSSGRYFIEGMKASSLMRAWLKRLGTQGAQIRYRHEWTGYEIGSEGVRLKFNRGDMELFDAACLCLGGGSYEPDEIPLRWPVILIRNKIRFKPFDSSNAGFEVEWPDAFLKEAEGLPIKNITLHSDEGNFSGDLTITRYGLEGTPAYSLTQPGLVYLDLKPNLSEADLAKKMNAATENLSPLRKIRKYLNPSPAALALLYHCTPHAERENEKALLSRLKRFPIELKAHRPLTEAISSSGGLALEELDGRLMLKKAPGVFAAGEMLDWDAPTGGFLIQACVSQGYAAAQGILAYLSNRFEKN